MQKLKNWFNRKTQAHLEQREQTGSFIGDYENNPTLRKRWLRVDIIGLIIFILIMLVIVSGVLDYDPDNDPDPTLTPVSSPEPTDATSTTPLPPTSNLLGAVIPPDAMPDQSTANIWQRPAVNSAG